MSQKDEEQVNKNRLRKCRKDFIDIIDPKYLTDHMIERGALTEDDDDEIRNTQPPTRLTRAKVLLRMVLCGRRGISMCDVLLEALENIYPDLAVKIKNTDVDENLGKYRYFKNTNRYKFVYIVMHIFPSNSCLFITGL